ncbi:ribonuclease J [Paenibacillus sp. NPDC058071]|uniref:ribonuclease J n=1 Tax=Paenibacillus sp. NPDC058071 TaxID=3346326 RepID=UPI0036DDFB39
MSKQKENKLSIFALGGVGEIGKNMYAVQYANDIIVIDCGSKFPDEELLGIDIIVPDISYLIENKDKVRALLITHGHEDHIGGLPYILKQLNMPVYASRLTMGLIEGKLKEAGLLGSTDRTLIHADSVLKLGSMTASFFKTNHSIPDSLGIVLDTPEGVVVQTGDFKFDQTPVGDYHADIHRMAEIGRKGVLALLSESTNAERPGFTPSERTVGANFIDAFRKAERRVIVSTFASNVHRLQQVIDAGAATGRKLAVIGRSMVNMITIASELGYLEIPDGMLIEPNEVNRYADNQVVILCTGSQGEPMSALTRMARSNHRQVEILEGDTVIISATPIPGNERSIGRTVDELFRLGANVIYGSGSQTGMHVSGHASQEELKLMIQLMSPKYFIPIHGEYRMQLHHKKLAVAMGVESENIFIVDNGEIVEIVNGDARKVGKVPAGNTYIDGLGIGDVGNIVLRDRKHLSQDGILVVVVTISKQDKTIKSGPDIISRGFVYVRESEGLLEEAGRIVTRTITKSISDNVNQWTTLKSNVKDSLGRFLYEQTKRKPMILPIIMEV